MARRSGSGRPPTRAADQPQVSEIDGWVARVGGMAADALRSEWRRVFGAEPPPAFSRNLLARAICYRLQEQAFGGLNASTTRLLRALSKTGAEPARQVKVGSIIVREHRGVLHEVLVVPGGFCWQGEIYDSLSAIARKITGVTWNGPRFFGLRTKAGGDEPNEQPALDANAAESGRAARQGRGAGGRRSSVGASGHAGGAP